jgi:DNA repair exonuclease SbcCD ATPase subunit
MELDLTLATRMRNAQRTVDQLTGEARAVAQAGLAAQQRIGVLTTAVELHERVNVLLTSLGEAEQEYAQRQIEELVTRGLQVVFDESLRFRVVQSVKASQANVDFMVVSSVGGQEIETPVMDARGGGLAAVVGFLLRLVILLRTPGARPVLALDEPFAHVSEEYEPRLAEFLREVADKAGVQIYLVTHSRAYDDVADRRYRLQIGSEGWTTAKEL